MTVLYIDSNDRWVRIFADRLGESTEFKSSPSFSNAQQTVIDHQGYDIIVIGLAPDSMAFHQFLGWIRSRPHQAVVVAMAKSSGSYCRRQPDGKYTVGKNELGKFIHQLTTDKCRQTMGA